MDMIRVVWVFEARKAMRCWRWLPPGDHKKVDNTTPKELWKFMFSCLKQLQDALITSHEASLIG